MTHRYVKNTILIFFFGGRKMKKIVILMLAALSLVSCATTEKSAKVYEYTEADVMIDAGDHKVPATITVPVVEEGVKVPAVVMLHGTGSNRHEALLLQEPLQLLQLQEL